MRLTDGRRPTLPHEKVAVALAREAAPRKWRRVYVDGFCDAWSGCYQEPPDLPDLRRRNRRALLHDGRLWYLEGWARAKQERKIAAAPRRDPFEGLLP